MLASCASHFGLAPTGLPLVEMDRFFAAPRDQRRSGVDAQARALDRMIRSCNQIRLHLHSLEALEAFVGLQRSPSRVRVRITEALTAAEPSFDSSYGVVGRRELEALRALGHRMPAALVWVFS